MSMSWPGPGQTHCRGRDVRDRRPAAFRHLGLRPGHQLGVPWHTAWDAIKAEAARRIAATGMLTGADALGVDEHVVRDEAARSHLSGF